jgi:hypothetical protein
MTVSYFGYELYKELSAAPGRVKVAEKIFQEQLVESIPIVRLLWLKYKTKLGTSSGGSGGEGSRVSINEDQKGRVLSKLDRLLTQQLADDLCKKHTYPLERYIKWF